MKGKQGFRVAVLGAGTIGGAVAEALAPHGSVVATRKRAEPNPRLEAAGVRLLGDNAEAAAAADLVVLAVKPRQVVPVLLEAGEGCAGKPVVSFAAAISLEILQRSAPRARFFRAMTNTAARIGQAFTVYAPGQGVLPEDREAAEFLLARLGDWQRVEETHLDVLTAMAGSGPAYIYTVLEALILGALRVGLPRDLALQAAAHTAIGAAHLLLESGEHPAELRDQVTTPGGVTIEGIYELEEGRVRTAFMKAVCAASAKASELAQAACVQAEECRVRSLQRAG